MYESPKSDLISDPEIRHLRLIKALLFTFIVIGVVESFDLIDFSDFDEFDLWFSVFYVGISVMVVWFVLHDIKVKPKSAYKFPRFFGSLLLVFAALNAFDSDMDIFSDVILLAVEAVLMLAVSIILKTNLKSR